MERFPQSVRPWIRSLTQLMYFANAQNHGIWASEIYRSAEETIRLVMVQMWGEIVATRAMDLLNLGGNEDFLDDFETAITEALQEENE